jgi:protein-disulfide isomerase
MKRSLKDLWPQQGEKESVATFVGYAGALGLDEIALRECLETGQMREQVRQNQWEGQQAGVQGTPSFLINGRLLSGAHSFDDLQQIIEAELQRVP